MAMPNSKIFFGVDAHGSTLIWKKWLRMPKIYDVDALIFTGDLIGKYLIPIIKKNNGISRVYYFGKTLTLSTEKEIEEVENKFDDLGIYSIRCNDDEAGFIQSDPSRISELIKISAEKRLHQWIDLLLKTIDTKKYKVMLMPGNDDGYYVDPFIQSYIHKGIIWCLDRIIELCGLEVISLAHVNPTPWDTPREATEKCLTDKIEHLVNKLNDPQKAIFNFHAPPYNTRIDLAPKLNHDKKPEIVAGQMSFVHVGSIAVRRAIEKYQPKLGLHGHVHESPGVERIGETICINPGTEYFEGILHGYMIEISHQNLEGYWKVEG